MTDPTPAKKTAAKTTRLDLQPPTSEERDAEKWAALAEPFPADWIERLPRNLKKNDDNRGKCEDTNAGRYYSADGHFCGGWHARSIHLDYVGHAGITMRLNSILGPGGWEYQPFALDADGMPIIGRQFYARLTIMGVTKWDLADNFTGAQEAYGDALRRCAMRFGVGTYLWSKSEQALDQAKATDNPPPDPAREAQRPGDRDAGDTPAESAESAEVQEVRRLLGEAGEDAKANLRTWWDLAAQEGAMPPTDNWRAITAAQVGMLATELATIQEHLAAPQGPQ